MLLILAFSLVALAGFVLGLYAHKAVVAEQAKLAAVGADIAKAASDAEKAL